MAEFLAAHWLDIFTTILGLAYILLEYKASIWLWLVGFVMPVMDVVLYWNHGLYGDAGMAVYYALAAAWGWFAWKFGGLSALKLRCQSLASTLLAKLVGPPKQAWAPPATRVRGWTRSQHKSPAATLSTQPSYMPVRLYIPVTIIFLVVWLVTYYVLSTYTNSSVPVLDAFTNALSIVAMWALARKYIEQWGFWIVVDAVCCYLYIKKGIPFKALLYGLYVAIAVAGWRRWVQMQRETTSCS